MAKLARFSEANGSGEFVVIFNSNDPDTSEYTEGGATLDEMVTILDDVTLFPTDRELRDPVMG